jgi:hypothetical protein
MARAIVTSLPHVLLKSDDAQFFHNSSRTDSDRRDRTLSRRAQMKEHEFVVWLEYGAGRVGPAHYSCFDRPADFSADVAKLQARERRRS